MTGRTIFLLQQSRRIGFVERVEGANYQESVVAVAEQQHHSAVLNKSGESGDFY